MIKKEAVQGMRVMPDKELYTITDLSTVWVNADIYEYELAQYSLGTESDDRSVLFPRPNVFRKSILDLTGSRRKNPHHEG